MLGPDNVICKNNPKVLQFKVQVPSEFKGKLEFKLKNDDFPLHLVDFCDMIIVKVGENMPCFDIITDANFAHSLDNMQNING